MALAAPTGGREGSRSLAALLAPLDTTMNLSSFGDPATVGPRAQELVAGLDQRIELLAQKTLDIKRVVDELRRLAGEPARDRDSAEQLASAIDVVVAELSEPANADALHAVDSGALVELRKLAEKLREE
jgi:hypothetical protein